MKIQYNNTENDTEVTGQASKTVELANGDKLQVKFLFWWDTLRNEFTTIDRGEITQKGVALAYFHKFGHFMTWNLRESNNYASEFSKLVGDMFSEVGKKIAKEHATI